MTTKKSVTATEVKLLLSVSQIVFKYKFNSNTAKYLEKKYKGEKLTLSEWQNKFKKDKLKF